MERPDEQLMKAFHEHGEEGALTVLYNKYKMRIFNYAYRVLGDRAQAEDATADVFLALFSAQYAYDYRAKFSTWLFTIARNQCVNQLRKKKGFISFWVTSKQTGQEDQWEMADDQELSRDALAKKEAAKALRKAIAGLAFNQREALVLREYHNLSYEEISQILDCSLENVKILIFRAREQLRVKLSPIIKEGDDE